MIASEWVVLFSGKGKQNGKPCTSFRFCSLLHNEKKYPFGEKSETCPAMV